MTPGQDSSGETADEGGDDRGPRCALLVFVDDATGDLMELRFARSESAFDYFASTQAYLTDISTWV